MYLFVNITAMEKANQTAILNSAGSGFAAGFAGDVSKDQRENEGDVDSTAGLVTSSF